MSWSDEIIELLFFYWVSVHAASEWENEIHSIVYTWHIKFIQLGCLANNTENEWYEEKEVWDLACVVLHFHESPMKRAREIESQKKKWY